MHTPNPPQTLTGLLHKPFCRSACSPRYLKHTRNDESTDTYSCCSIAAPRSCVLLVEWNEMGIGVRCNVQQHKHADESPGLPPRHSHVHVHVHLQPHHKPTALPSLPRTSQSPRSYADMHMYSRVHTHAPTHSHTHRHTHTPHPIRCAVIECGTYQAGRWRRGTRWRRLPPRGRRDRSKGRRRTVTAGTTATAPRRRMALAGACEGGRMGVGSCVSRSFDRFWWGGWHGGIY